MAKYDMYERKFTKNEYESFIHSREYNTGYGTYGAFSNLLIEEFANGDVLVTAKVPISHRERGIRIRILEKYGFTKFEA